MNDPTCNSASITPDGSAIVRTGSELFIFVDTTWQWHEILPIVSYLLDNIDVNPFGTFFTIMNAMDGNVIVSRTQSLADMHTNWTLDSQQTRKFNLTKYHYLIFTAYIVTCTNVIFKMASNKKKKPHTNFLKHPLLFK